MEDAEATTGRRIVLPAPLAAAVAASGASWKEGVLVSEGLHVEIDRDGALVTGSLVLSPEVGLRAAGGRLRMLVPGMPETIATALPGRHIATVLDHPHLHDPRLLITTVKEEQGRMSIDIVAATTVLQEPSA